jgi:hypothetical protein
VLVCIPSVDTHTQELVTARDGSLLASCHHQDHTLVILGIARVPVLNHLQATETTAKNRAHVRRIPKIQLLATDCNRTKSQSSHTEVASR